MNRLAVRLLLGMLTVAFLSLIIVPIAQNIAERGTFEDLAPDFRDRVEHFEKQRSESARDENDLPRLSEGQSSDDAFLAEENVRLLSLLSDYRSAQRQAIAIGVAGAMVLSTLLALLLSRTIAAPIEAVSKAASQLAGGNLGTRVQLERFYYPSVETRALGRDFNVMASALEHAESERKIMIADIAHELRNPLATLQMRLDALTDGLVSFNDREATILQSQVGLLERLIDDLRLLSLAEAGQLSLYQTDIDLNTLVANTVTQARPIAKGTGIDLTFNPSPEPALVWADPDRLSQVLNNLLDNAVRVTPPGASVTVGLIVTAHEVILQVQDGGPGIPEHELPTVFERFVQGRRRDTRSVAGSGLGLAIVQSLIGLHSGSVRASNHNGALLEVVLPRLTSKSN